MTHTNSAAIAPKAMKPTHILMIASTTVKVMMKVSMSGSFEFAFAFFNSDGII